MANASAPGIGVLSPELKLIVSRSLFLSERLRLEGCALPTSLPEEEAREAEVLLERWEEAIGACGVACVLSRYGYSRTEALALLSRHVEARQQETAGWTELLQEVFEETLPVFHNLILQPDTSLYPYLERTEPLPFEELLVPFVAVGWRRLERAAGAAARALSAQARERLCRALLSLLSHFALPTFASEFALERNLEGSFPWGTKAPSNQGYREFVSRLLQQDFRSFFEEYSVLARLLSSWTERWANAQAQLLRRLQRDWPLLCGTLLVEDSECFVSDIVPYRSDPHQDGDSVSILIFAKGQRLVYKPRPLDMEAEFPFLTQWMNKAGFPWPLYSAKTLARDIYGWMEFIPKAPCRDRDEVEAFYARCGGLLCLLCFLQGTDIHYENLVAMGSDPVLVDLETLFHPQLSADFLSALGPGAGEKSCGSIDLLFRTGLLPRPGGGAGRAQLDFSALGTSALNETPFWITSCEGVNGDDMALTQKRYRPSAGNNIPLLEDRPQTADLYMDALLEGFRSMYALVLRHREELVQAGGPLQRFAKKRGRLVARATNTYGLLLQESLHPRSMRNGAARSLCFERLFGAAAAKDSSACWPLWEEELRSLEQMTLPYFVTVSDEAPCESEDARRTIPFEQVRSRIALAREEDLPQYLTAIVQAFATPEQAYEEREAQS